jgi:hypothetical protein
MRKGLSPTVLLSLLCFVRCLVIQGFSFTGEFLLIVRPCNSKEDDIKKNLNKTFYFKFIGNYCFLLFMNMYTFLFVLLEQIFLGNNDGRSWLVYLTDYHNKCMIKKYITKILYPSQQ